MNAPPDDQTNRRILVIDDNRDIHNYFREILHGRPVGFTMESAHQGVEGVQLLRQALEKGEPYAVAFVDMQMPPGIDGIETITKLWELDADLQVVICTGHSDCRWNELTSLGNSDRLLILKKPFDLVEVRQMAEALSVKWELLRRGRNHLEDLEARVTERTQNLARANQDLRDQIAERKQAEAALRESELRFRQLAENSSEVFWVASPTGEELFYIGPAYEQITGWSCQSIYEDPKQWFKNILEEDRPPVAKALSELSQGTITTWNIASGIAMVPSGGSVIGVLRYAATTEKSSAHAGWRKTSRSEKTSRPRWRRRGMRRWRERA